MEELKTKLYKLVIAELDDLSIGYFYNAKRISAMKEICHLLNYFSHVEIDDSDIIKMMKFYD